MTYRDNIDKLARRITDRIPAKVKKLSQMDPEYECLNEILNDEQCDLCLCFEVRKPLSFEEVVKRSGWPAGRVNRVLNEVCDIGMIEYNWENADHHKQFVLPQFVPGAAEFMVMNKDLVEEHPIVADFFEKMTRLPLEKVTPMVPPGGAGIGMHVIPVEKAIHANQEAVSVEKISHWLNKYDKYALSPCSCRRQQRVRGEGTGDVEADVCIAVDDMADYIELDVQLTSDGEVIVMHDSNAYRTTGVDENIVNMTYKEVRRLDAGSWYSEQYKGEKVPSLREVLELTQGKIKLNIELKPAGNGDELAKKTAALIEKYNMTADCVVTSFSKSALLAVKSYNENVKVGYILSAAYGDFYDMSNIDFFSVNAAYLSKRTIDAIHNSGKQVYAWTVNNKDSIKNLTNKGVDGVITDNPVLARETIYSRDTSETIVNMIRYVFNQ